MKSNKVFKKEATKNENKEMTSKEKYDNFWNKIFIFLICVSVVGIYYFIRDINEWRKLLNSLNPDYKLPGWSDLKICLMFSPIFVFIKVFLNKPLTNFCSKVMKEAYRNPKNDKDRELAKRYKVKLPDHLIKITFYTFITIFGFFLLRNLEYFPKSLLGNGYFPNILREGYPGCFFHTKPKYFDYYYMLALSYFSVDSIFFFLQDKQTDFINMLLHHIVTISLILFSYYTNISHVGCVVLYLHILTDIFVHLTRFLLQTDVSEIIKSISGVTLVFVYMYVRIYVLGDVIYTLWAYSNFSWHRICYFLFIFLSVLYILHINWAVLLLQKFFLLLSGTKITDTASYNTNKENKDNKQKKIN